MHRHLSIGLALSLAFCPGVRAQGAANEVSQTYRVRQTAILSEIPEGARSVRWWVAIPGDERHQEILDFTVVAVPGRWRISREAERGNRFLFLEIPAPKATELRAVVEFTLRRRPVMVEIDPAEVGALTDAHRQLFAAELVRDAPHMVVTPPLQAIADEVCGNDGNLAVQARKLLDHVADAADHYSKDPSKPHCGVGDAEDCLTNGGGCCTDLHALFIALARARGIPARLQMGYRLLPKNEGKEVDPGYRCWAEYFLPGYGWVPADIVEADAPGGLGRARWFSGLTERRLWLNEGREFELHPRQAGTRVNTMIIGHAEIDGKAARVLPEGNLKPQLTRTVHFTALPHGPAPLFRR